MIYPLIQAHQADAKVTRLCQTLRVSSSGYYAWRQGKPGQRATLNAVLQEKIVAIHRDSAASYGRYRIRAALQDEGWTVNHKRITRLMNIAQIRGISRRRAWTTTTQREVKQSPAADWVQRQFVASAPNQLWVADMTYIPTWAGFLYLAVVIDVYSRKVVGWAFSLRMTSELVIAALNMGLTTRQPQSVIHHSDQGSQYTSLAFGKRCQERGVQPSMGSVGDAYDNALAESFFASLECELIDRHSWPTQREAKMAVFRWIEGWYNPRRKHSAIGYRSPIQFEAHYQNALQHGLPAVGYGPVDNGVRAPDQGAHHCPQASPLDNPSAMIRQQLF